MGLTQSRNYMVTFGTRNVNMNLDKGGCTLDLFSKKNVINSQNWYGGIQGPM
jgi:hypothetical protein